MPLQPGSDLPLGSSQKAGGGEVDNPAQRLETETEKTTSIGGHDLLAAEWQNDFIFPPSLC